MLEIVFPFRGTTYYCGSIGGVGPVSSNLGMFLTMGLHGYGNRPPHPSFWSIAHTLKVSFNIHSDSNFPPVTLEEPLPQTLVKQAEFLRNSIKWYHGAGYRQNVADHIRALVARPEVAIQENRLLTEATKLREQFIGLWTNGLASVPHVVLEYTPPRLNYGSIRANQN